MSQAFYYDTQDREWKSLLPTLSTPLSEAEFVEHTQDRDIHISSDDRLRWDSVNSKANTSHSHEINDINGLQNELNNKQPTGDYVTNTSLNSKGYVIESVANSRYATKQELREIQLTPGPKGDDGTSVVVEVVSSPPSVPQPNTLYLVRA